MAGTVRFCCRMKGAQGSGAQNDTVLTFNYFSLIHHLKLPLQSHKLVQYGAGTCENQCFCLL